MFPRYLYLSVTTTYERIMLGSLTPEDLATGLFCFHIGSHARALADWEEHDSPALRVTDDRDAAKNAHNMLRNTLHAAVIDARSQPTHGGLNGLDELLLRHGYPAMLAHVRRHVDTHDRIVRHEEILASMLKERSIPLTPVMHERMRVMTGSFTSFARIGE